MTEACVVACIACCRDARGETLGRTPQEKNIFPSLHAWQIQLVCITSCNTQSSIFTVYAAVLLSACCPPIHWLTTSREDGQMQVGRSRGTGLVVEDSDDFWMRRYSVSRECE